MTPSLEELKKLAEAAEAQHPSPWVTMDDTDITDDVEQYVVEGFRSEGTGVQDDSAAAFIAAANPAAILALIERCEKAEAMLHECFDKVPNELSMRIDALLSLAGRER